METELEIEEWNVSANEPSEVLAYHIPCETFFNYGWGPDNDGLVPLLAMLEDMKGHQDECDAVSSDDEAPALVP